MLFRRETRGGGEQKGHHNNTARVWGELMLRAETAGPVGQAFFGNRCPWHFWFLALWALSDWLHHGMLGTEGHTDPTVCKQSREPEGKCSAGPRAGL